MAQKIDLRSAPRPLIAATLLLVLAAGSALWLLRPHDRAHAPAAAVPRAHTFQPTEAQLAALAVTTVRTRPFHTEIRTEGSVALNDEATTPVYSPYSGRVIHVLARLGDVVRRGDPLMRVAGGEYAQGQSDVAAARAAVTATRAAETRQRALFEAGAASERDWLQAQSDRAAAEAAWNAARGRLQVLGLSDTQIDALERSPIGHAEAPVVAPVTGTVVQRQVADGQYVQSAAAGAATPAFVIADLRRLWLLAYVREADAAKVHRGQAVEVSVPGLDGRRYAGRLDWVGAALDPATHRLPVRFSVDNGDGQLRPQMFAEASISTSDDAVAPAVPAAAIVYDGDVTRLFVVDGKQVTARAVRTGRSQGGFVEVVEGIRPGERIVTEGTLFVDHAIAGD